MNVGEKWKLSSGDTIYEIEQVSCDRRFLTMREGNGDLLSLDTHGLTSSYLEKVEEPTIGSYWIAPNNKLITVLNIIEDRIRYYFGEAYCFTKVEHENTISRFLSEMVPFTGNPDNYDNAGTKKEPNCITGDCYFTIPVNTERDHLAPFCSSVLTDVGNQFPIYDDHQYCEEPITKPPTNIEKETNIEQEIFDMMYQKYIEDVSNEFIYGSDFKNWSNLKKYIAKLEDTNVLIVCGSQRQADERRKEFISNNEKNMDGSFNFMLRNIVQVVSREYEGTCFKADLVIFDDCDNLDQNTKNSRLESLRFSENPRYEVWEKDSQVSNTGMMFSSKKPLWKRILRKLV